jgi:hypothetical protein
MTHFSPVAKCAKSGDLGLSSTFMIVIKSRTQLVLPIEIKSLILTTQSKNSLTTGACILARFILNAGNFDH